MATANIKAVITAEDRASSTIAGFNGGLGKMTAAIALGNIAARGFEKAISAVGDTMKYAFTQTAEIQKSVAGIQALTANSAEASKVIKDMIEYVKGKPFDRLDAIGAAKQLLAFGRSAKDVVGDIDLIGRAVLASGRDWTSLTRVIGRVTASNKLLREDFNILSDSGIGLATALQKRLGKSMEEVFQMMSDGEINAKIFREAMEDALPASLIERSANTIGNKMISLKASVRDLGFAILGVDFNELSESGEPLVRPGGLLDKLTDGMDRLVKFFRTPEFVGSIKNFSDNLMNIAKVVAEFLGPKIQELIINLKIFWQEVIAPMIPVIGTLLVAAIATVIDTMNAWLPILTEHKELIWVIIGAMVAWKAVMAIQGVVAAFNASLAVMNGALYGSTAAVGGLRGAILALPVAIAIGVALLGYEIVKHQLDVLKNDLDNLQKSRDNRPNLETYLSTYNRIKDTRGIEAAQEYARQQNRQLGGPIMAGQPYMVGEAGPEVIVPRVNGTVVPNNELQKAGMSGGVTINVNSPIVMNSGVDGRRFAEAIWRNLQDLNSSRGVAGM